MRWDKYFKKYRDYLIFLIVTSTVLVIAYFKYTKSIPDYGPTNSTVYHFYSRMTSHYGDNIFPLKFFYNISDHLRKRGITIYYYYNPKYIKKDELDRYINKDTMVLRPMHEKPSYAVMLYLILPMSGVYVSNSFDEYFGEMYKRLVNYMGLADLGIDTSLYQKEEYLLKIYEKLPDKFKDIDILFINSEPKTEKIINNKESGDAAAIELSKRYRIVTTSPVNDEIPCTFTDGLMLQVIGAVSTHAKYIIGVNSGPLIPCLNYYAKQSVKKWIFVSRDRFTQIPYRRIHDYNNLSEIVISEIEGGNV